MAEAVTSIAEGGVLTITLDRPKANEMARKNRRSKFIMPEL